MTTINTTKVYDMLTDRQMRICLNPPPYLEELITKTNPPKNEIYIPPIEFQNKRPNLPVEIWEKIFKILHRMCLAESLEVLTTIKKYASIASKHREEERTEVPFKFWKYHAIQENYEYNIHYNLNQKYDKGGYTGIPHNFGNRIWNTQYNRRHFNTWTDDQQNHERAIYNKEAGYNYPRMWYVGSQDGMLRYGIEHMVKCLENERPKPILFKVKDIKRTWLVDMCKENKLKVSGNKKVLAKRLMSI